MIKEEENKLFERANTKRTKHRRWIETPKRSKQQTNNNWIYNISSADLFGSVSTFLSQWVSDRSVDHTMIIHTVCEQYKLIYRHAHAHTQTHACAHSLAWERCDTCVRAHLLTFHTSVIYGIWRTCTHREHTVAHHQVVNATYRAHTKCWAALFTEGSATSRFFVAHSFTRSFRSFA